MARETTNDPGTLDALVAELGDLIVETGGGSLTTDQASTPAGPAVDASLSVIRAADEVTKFAYRGRSPADATPARDAVENARKAIRAARAAPRSETE